MSSGQVVQSDYRAHKHAVKKFERAWYARVVDMRQYMSEMANRCGSFQYKIVGHGAKCRANFGYECERGMLVDT